MNGSFVFPVLSLSYHSPHPLPIPGQPFSTPRRQQHRHHHHHQGKRYTQGSHGAVSSQGKLPEQQRQFIQVNILLNILPAT
jgi:hypothetical protein